jgi:hypothetical protein
MMTDCFLSSSIVFKTKIKYVPWTRIQKFQYWCCPDFASFGWSGRGQDSIAGIVTCYELQGSIAGTVTCYELQDSIASIVTCYELQDSIAGTVTCYEIQDSIAGTVTCYEVHSPFHFCPDWPWGPPNLLQQWEPGPFARDKAVRVCPWPPIII